MIIEVIAVLFTLLSVYLTIKENILCWPLSIIGCLAYFLIFKEQNNYINMGLQVLFTIQSIYGVIVWGKSKPKISNISKKGIYYCIIAMLLMSLLFYFISYHFFGDDVIIDSITTSLSIIGTTLLSYKILQSWIVWSIVDLLYFLMFIDNQLYLSATLYILFLILTISGFKNWKNEISPSQ